MAKLSTEFKVTGIQQMKDLIEVLADHYEELPDPVKDALLQVDGDPSAYDYYYVKSIIGDGMYDQSFAVYVDGKKADGVESGRRIGKRVVYSLMDSPASKTSIRKPSHTAESFWVTHGNDYICGWGEKPALGGE